MNTEEINRQNADAVFAHLQGKPVQVVSKSNGLRWTDIDYMTWNFNDYNYRPKPEPVTRPWSKPDDVPGPVCYIKGRGDSCGWMLIVSANPFGVSLIGRMPFEPEETTGAHRVPWVVLEQAEHSADRITWKPCTVTE